MPATQPTRATPYQAEILHLHGPDAPTFADNQLASRMDQLTHDQWQWTAWLDAAGKVRMLGMAWTHADGIAVLLRGGSAERVATAMRAYVLRAQVTLEASRGSALAAGPALAQGRLEHTDGALVFGCGDYSLRLDHGDGDDAADTGDTLLQHAIAAGHPWLPDTALDTLLPPALGLHRLGAVTLGKGCYPGQEMVNRLHTRGGHKYGLAHVRAEAAWQAGDRIEGDGRNLGTVLMRHCDDALVVMRDDATDTLADGRVIQRFSA